jgi:hypothetical protein
LEKKMFHVEVDYEHNRILLAVEGFLDKSEQEALAAGVVSAATDIRSRSPWFNMLLDVSRAVPREQSGDPAMDQLRKYVERFGVRRIAVIMGKGLVALQMKRDVSSITVEVGMFDDRQEGLAWLDEGAAALMKAA